MLPMIPNTYLRRISLLVLCALSLVLTVGDPSLATAQDQEHCTTWVGKIVSAKGVVQARRVSHTSWEPTKVGETLCPGDKLRVETWRAAIVMANETIIRLDQGTTITFTEIENEKTSWLDLLEGIVHFISRVPQNLTITTPFVNATVEGTEFVIRVDSNETNVWVLEGTVRVENTLGQLLLDGGEAAVTREGEAPKRQIDIKPRDAVQWALYYPPLLDVSKDAITGPNQEILRDALAQYQMGNIRRALDQLNTIPLKQRDPQFLGIRSGLLLSVGQINKAKIDIAEALRQNPEDSTALALQSVVALVNNKKEDALQLATQAVANSPNSSIAHVALSYAQQANFDIEQALESSQQATTHSPEDALTWARVAELQLSLGHLSEAREAAQQAVELNPSLARTQTILGFALLTEAKIADARSTFEKAITLDQADPLPRLGSGLTKIQNSHLAEGRRDIEIASSLDPSNSIIRSYLGKAYFEEKWETEPTKEFTLTDLHNDTKQNKKAAAQLQMAKELDPQDPTPHFYDAIRKQSVNQPVEALKDLQKSIELNDNRAVYRSQLLLDNDHAARSASLGRIFNDLGFQQRSLVEGWKSLATAPENHSAHRLLADSYASRPRHDIARVSELLQTQLLQPININNLQPQLGERGIQILEGAGPSSLSFNEFNPLFMRDRVAFLSNIIFGNHDTFGDNMVVSAMLADPVSISLGQFHYESNGFRPNNDVEHNIYNAFLQATVHPKINFQAEFRRRESKQGDLSLRFDPDNFRTADRRDIDQDTKRLGGKFTPWTHSNFIFSGIFTKRNEVNLQPPFIEGTLKQKGRQFEGQYLFQTDNINAIIGGGINRVKDTKNIRFGPFNFPSQETSRHENGYVYTNITAPSRITWTLGVSYDSMDIRAREVKKVSPKVGGQWTVLNGVQLRAAYLQSVKRIIVVDQTIELTQVAGFNQFFDDPDGSESERYGIGLDVTLSPTVFGGVEFSRRDLEVPVNLGGGNTQFFDRREDIVRGYFYWAFCKYWAFSTEAIYERFQRSSQDPSVFLPPVPQRVPSTVRTLSVPLAARFFHPGGFFGELGGIFVNQKIDPPPGSTFSPDSDRFFLVNAAFGYRFPARRGIISLEAKNLLDKKFFYQDVNIHSPREDISSAFIPDRTVLIRLTIALN